jgi:hypothetical protein
MIYLIHVFDRESWAGIAFFASRALRTMFCQMHPVYLDHLQPSMSTQWIRQSKLQSLNHSFHEQCFLDCRLQLVAEEDSKELRMHGSAKLLATITSLVTATLRTEFPQCPNLSSDDVLSLIDLGNSDAGSIGRHWVLDPIDGTRGFTAGRQYAVCLGMLKDGQMKLGILGCPNLPLGRRVIQVDAEPMDDAGMRRDCVGAVFAAVRGFGAYAGPLESQVTSAASY